MSALRVLLLVRGAMGVLFALSKLAPAAVPVTQSLARNGTFALIDGLLALAVAIALSKAPRFRWLFVLAMADALTRLAIGVVALAYPDVEGRILGSIAFFGAIITACAALGAFGLFVVLTGRGGAPADERGGVAPVLVISTCTLLLGVGLLFGFESADGRRLLIGGATLVVGLCLLVSAFRLKGARSMA